MPSFGLPPVAPAPEAGKGRALPRFGAQQPPTARFGLAPAPPPFDCREHPQCAGVDVKGKLFHEWWCNYWWGAGKTKTPF